MHIDTHIYSVSKIFSEIMSGIGNEFFTSNVKLS